MSIQCNSKEIPDLENLVLVKGFDLFFDDICEESLKDIALDLGGNSRFDLDNNKVTYMFNKAIYMNIDEINKCHQIINVAGEHFSGIHECDYVTSELYLNVSEKQLNDLQKK